MIFSMSKGALQNALDTVSKYTGQSAAYLACVHIDAGDRVTFAATDLTESAMCTESALIDERGACLISAKRLGEIVKTLPDQAVTVEAYSDRAAIRCGRAEFAIPALDPADFPGVLSFKAESSMTVAREEWADMVRKCASFASVENTRPILKGILLDAKGGILRMVATDGYRLICCESDSDAEFSVVVPAAFASATVKGTGDVTVSYDGGYVMVESGDSTFTTRRLEGNYPKWEQLMPSDVDGTATFDMRDIAGAVKRASIFGRTVPVRIWFEGDTAHIDANGGENGRMSEEVSCEAKGACDIGVNASYAADALGAMGGDRVTLGFTSSVKPLLIVDGRTRAIVMPVRV